MLKTVIKWGLVALLVFFVVTQPADAANAVHVGLDGAKSIASGFSAFVANLS